MFRAMEAYCNCGIPVESNYLVILWGSARSLLPLRLPAGALPLARAFCYNSGDRTSSLNLDSLVASTNRRLLWPDSVSMSIMSLPSAKPAVEWTLTLWRRPF